jgi:zinc protease
VLSNGLTVVVMEDRSIPIVGVAVAYDVGFRSEPEGRTGFAHLFEHLMFQGSANAAKGEQIRLIEGAGGVFNGFTTGDATLYHEALPSGGLELALFLEADRMGALAVTEENLANQVAVVKEEINVNVLNQPYGGFPWISLPGLAFDSYPNAHNGYGDFAHLEMACLDDVQDFYEKYYAPSNAVLAVAGDCDPEAVFSMAEKHFGWIKTRKAPPHGPWPEPPLSSDRHRRIDDPLAPQPAFVVGYRAPDPEGELDAHIALTVAASILSDGDASRLRSRLVHRDRTVTDLDCLIGVFGVDQFFMRQPVLFQVIVFHPGEATTDQLCAVIDEELARLADTGPTPDELARVTARFGSSYWRSMDPVMQRAVSIASVEAVRRSAELVFELPERVAAVSAEAVAAAAAGLLAQHRAIVEIVPAGPRAGEGR